MNKNKQIIAKIFSHVLKEKYPKNIQKRIFKELLWSCTEDTDNGKRYKYKIPYWSKKAIQRFESLHSTDNLVHDHMVPRKIITSEIFGLKNQSPAEIFKILKNYCHACIITKE